MNFNTFFLLVVSLVCGSPLVSLRCMALDPIDSWSILIKFLIVALCLWFRASWYSVNSIFWVFSALTWIQYSLAGRSSGLDRSFHRSLMGKGHLVAMHLLVGYSTHQTLLYFPQGAGIIFLELSYICSVVWMFWSAAAFWSDRIEGKNGREKSGRRNTVDRIWGIKRWTPHYMSTVFGCA